MYARASAVPGAVSLVGIEADDYVGIYPSNWGCTMELTMEKQKEGRVARAIEKQTSRIPSDFFLWGALGSMGISLVLAIAKQGKASTFVSQWVPTLLLFGVYNKIVKVAGHDVEETRVH